MDDGAQLRNRINKQVYNARKRMKLNAKLLHCLAHKHTVMQITAQYWEWGNQVFFLQLISALFFSTNQNKNCIVCAFFQFVDIFLKTC